jgi:hypothetical protein
MAFSLVTDSATQQIEERLVDVKVRPTDFRFTKNAKLLESAEILCGRGT